MSILNRMAILSHAGRGWSKNWLISAEILVLQRGRQDGHGEVEVVVDSGNDSSMAFGFRSSAGGGSTEDQHGQLPTGCW